ncbi:MAG: prolipoprotein diacylglyceryl transferase [Deltaproteobacteria bacterium]|nr:prolipoprotein diacylglyceryl transferase [Deltaproteobacteria bacterium]
MHPTFDIGITTLPAYFTLLMVGFTLAILWAHKLGVAQGMPGNPILDCGLLMLACGLVGSRALHIVADGQFWDYVHLCTDPMQVPALSLGRGLKCASDAQCLDAGLGDWCETASGLCRQRQDCLRVFKIWYGGYAYYGGFLLAVPTGIWFLRKKRMPIWRVADLASFGIAMGLVFGRVGCFLAGCCFGGITDSGLAVRFGRWSPAWDRHLADHRITDLAAQSLPVHATQLYEAAACAVISWLCWRRVRSGVRFQGEAFFWFMLLYAAFRFGVEFLRADDRGLWLGGALSTSQLISLPLLVWSAWVLWRGKAWPDAPDVPGSPAAGPSEDHAAA